MIARERLTFSVSELNQAIRFFLESNQQFADVCVLGELSNYKIYPSGHHYFTLKDQESSLRCVMFRSSASKLRYRPENGMRVSAFGSIRVFPRDGVYQLNCSAIVPDGVGDLQIAFEQLKRRLDEEGLFRADHKKALPRYPKRVALITSSAGAAVHDMIRIFRHRWPMTKLILMPVRVQGTEAPAEIASAIRYANEHRVADLLITGRGGGSLEDLWAFNDERVARAIYASEIPVISAVGHEPDITISDYVADCRAATPSNAAEIAVPDHEEIEAVVGGLRYRLNQEMNHILQKYRQLLKDYSGKKILLDAASFVDFHRVELDRTTERLMHDYRELLGMKQRDMIQRAAALDAMSPLKVLERGYLVAEDAGRMPVRSVNQLSVGDSLFLRLSDGTAQCRVEDLKENENDTGKYFL